MDRSSLSPEESLTIISKAIANVKINFREYSKIFLLWGWIMSLASFSNFVILKVLHAREAHQLMGVYSLGNWLVFALIAFIILFFINRRTDRDKKVYSHLETYIKNLWIVTAAAFFIGTFICIKLEINPPPFMLLIAGLATVTSGLFIRFLPVILGGAVFFIGSVISTFVSNEYTALIVGMTIICGYIIPGYFLKFSK